ncbi:MAG: hypothetical protein DRP08_05525 [Candidatus Aenigmatarchaeota archaeon]|nr:MAG: hypothetical protein DRP08_05525 [Candidatus Aenigmarchaeota archaeon]
MNDVLIRQYRKIRKGEFFVVGVDTAAGGIDNCVAQFLSKTGTDIPLVYSENITATEATPKIKMMLDKVKEKTGIRPVVAYERNNGGVFEMERLLRMNKDDKYRGYEMMEYGTNKGRIPFKIGWETNGATRPKMLADFKEAIDNKLLRIYDQQTIDELYGFIIVQMKTRWKATADFGKHDDCFIAGTKILTDKGQINIENIKVGNLVMTRRGYKPVIKIRNRVKEVINSKIGLTGTSTHPVITSRGEVSLAKVKDSDIIHVWNQKKRKIEKLSYIKAKSTIAIPNQKEDNIGFIIGGMTNGKQHHSRFINKFGLITWEKYQKAITYIIKMGICLIIKLEILQLYLAQIIQNFTCRIKKGSKHQERTGESKQKGLRKLLESGEKKIQKRHAKYIKKVVGKMRRKDKKVLENGEKKIQKRQKFLLKRIVSIYSLIPLEKPFAKTVEKSLNILVKGVENIVNGNAPIKQVTRKERVYNLQIAECPEYFANNILVHNCIMSAAIAWQLYQSENPIEDIDANSLPSQKLFDGEGFY